MYKIIQSHYITANQFGAITKSQACAIKQIARAGLGTHLPFHVLDLGVGDGAFAKELSQVLPNAEFTGIDISAQMLKHAHEKLPSLRTIAASATEASNYLPHHSQDLVLTHFVNAYIPFCTLFCQADSLVREKGYFSLITTTYESFPNAQHQLAEFVSQDSIISRIVGHFYKAVVKNTTVASGLDEVMQQFKSHDFEVIEHQRLEVPIQFNNIDELIRFGIEGTWFLNSIAMRMLPKNFLMQRLKRLFGKIFTFPFQDTHVIDVVLGRK